MATCKITIVSPVYRAANLVPILVRELHAVLSDLTDSYEIILVDDGSPDSDWDAIREQCAQSDRVVGIQLSRNFGQHYAIAAGLSKAKGRWVVVMDCDLQDQPAEIPNLLRKAEQGFDMVLARRAVRQDSWLKRASSISFYRILGYLTGLPQDPAIANFGIYSDKVIAAINKMPETIRYFPTMVSWVGFKRTTLDVVHAARPDGRTSYNLKKLLNLAIDICLAYSDKPLRLAVKTGFVISGIGFLFAAYTLVLALLGHIVVLGYASLIVSIWALAGLNILIMGVVGLYVGKSFEGIKRRPSFIIADEINSHGN